MRRPVPNFQLYLSKWQDVRDFARMNPEAEVVLTAWLDHERREWAARSVPRQDRGGNCTGHGGMQNLGLQEISAAKK